MEQPTSQLWVHQQKRRYYRAYLCRDLFGAVYLYCVWGSLDSKQGGERSEIFSHWGEALEQMEKVSKRRRQHGYVPAA